MRWATLVGLVLVALVGCGERAPGPAAAPSPAPDPASASAAPTTPVTTPGLEATTASGTAPDPGAAPTAPGALDGRTFLADGLGVDGVVRPAVAGTRLSMRFERAQVSVYADCNASTGTYRIGDGRLVLIDLMRTEMACPAELHAQDELLTELVVGWPAVTLEGDRLVLTSDRIRFEDIDREVADPDRTLVGTTWAYNGTFEPPVARFGPLRSVVVSAADATVAVSGCRAVAGTYTVEGDQLTIALGPPVGTPCGPDETAEEDRFLAKLAGNHTLTIEATSARLVRADGSGVGLMAQP